MAANSQTKGLIRGQKASTALVELSSRPKAVWEIISWSKAVTIAMKTIETDKKFVVKTWDAIKMFRYTGVFKSLLNKEGAIQIFNLLSYF